MSWQAVRWALYDSGVEDATRLLVLIVLAEKANKHGRGARPSVETVAGLARIAPRTAQGHMTALREAGLIVARSRVAEGGERKTMRGPGGTLIYDLPIDRPATGVLPSADEQHPDAVRGQHPDAEEPPLNHPQNHPTRDRAAIAEIEKRADAITRRWWEGFNPRPSGSFPGFCRIVRSLLRAGWEQDDVYAAMNRCGATFNRAALERELRKGQQGPSWDPSYDGQRARAWDV